MAIKPKKISQKLSGIYEFEFLNKDEEFELIKNWREKSDKKALEKLVMSHMRFVRKIAYGYRGYGLPVEDMVSEGYLGIMQAVRSFAPERGFKFSTYAGHCIRTALQNFILKAKSIVSVKPNNDNKKMFFGAILRTKKHDDDGDVNNNGGQITELAKELSASESTIDAVLSRFSKKDFSLNATIDNEGGEDVFQDWLVDPAQKTEQEILLEIDLAAVRTLIDKALCGLSKRELEVVKRRRLGDEEVSLRDLGDELGLSGERVRQIEHSAMEKIRNFITLELKTRKTGQRHGEMLLALLWAAHG